MAKTVEELKGSRDAKKGHRWATLRKRVKQIAFQG